MKQHFTPQISSAIALSLLLVSCGVIGPEHAVPETETVGNFKSPNASYSARMSKNWWRQFGDSKLNGLMTDLEKGNFDLRAAESRRNQAYAVLGMDRSAIYPQLNGNASASRNRATESDRSIVPGGMRTYYNDYRVSMSLGYEIDLWGRVHRIVEAGRANAEAAEISVDQVKLSLQTQLASSYFALRFIDSESAVLEEAVKIRKESLDLTRELSTAGKSTELDVAKAEAELANAKAQLVSLQGPRASLENAIAVLLGKNASNFTISQKTINRNAPSVSAGSPVELLGRRPDVFIAERKLAASSAEIGIAKAEFYPKISLIGSGGYASVKSSDFIKHSSRQFSIGPDVEIPLFQGFRLKSNLAQAKANHEESLANYQQAVLMAFADVENALAARRAAINEITARQDSVTAAKKAFELSNSRYREGAATFLDVIDSQRELLNAELYEVQARGRSYAATIQLMQALGGGFSK